MTIRRDPATSDWMLLCNSCKTDERFAPSHTFAAIVTWVKAQAWKAQHLFGRWRHYCPTCAEAQRCHQLDQRVDRERLHA